MHGTGSHFKRGSEDLNVGPPRFRAKCVTLSHLLSLSSPFLGRLPRKMLETRKEKGDRGKMGWKAYRTL